jgi:hypothetical protein
MLDVDGLNGRCYPQNVLLAAVDRTIVIVGVLGASTALAGLLVVFLISAYASWPENADVGQKNQYRYGVIASAVGVVLAVLVALLATVWLLGVDLFGLSVGGFILLLVLVIGLSAAATRLALE